MLPGAFWSFLQLPATSCHFGSSLELPGAPWSFLELLNTSWSFPELPVASQVFLELPGASSRKLQEFSISSMKTREASAIYDPRLWVVSPPPYHPGCRFSVPPLPWYGPLGPGAGPREPRCTKHQPSAAQRINHHRSTFPQGVGAGDHTIPLGGDRPNLSPYLPLGGPTSPGSKMTLELCLPGT